MSTIANFDPSTFNSRLAVLAARADGGQFVLKNVATGTVFVPHRFGEAFRPKSQSWQLVTWTAIYRTLALSEQLVCDTSVLPFAQIAMLVSASMMFDLQDVRAATLGTPIT